MTDFERTYQEALALPFQGWDFSALAGRWTCAPPPWDYRELVLERLRSARALLDIGTGGGEFLAGLGRLPPRASATEAYRPNVPVARARLAPLGVDLVQVSCDGRLPFTDAAFDLVIDRHEHLDAGEARRVLAAGGWLVTQQVGGQDQAELNRALGDASRDAAGLDLAAMRRALERAGLVVVRAEEAFLPARFHDIGAVVYYLRAIPWQVPGLDLCSPAARRSLEALDERMRCEGGLATTQHRFLIVCRR